MFDDVLMADFLNLARTAAATENYLQRGGQLVVLVIGTNDIADPSVSYADFQSRYEAGRRPVWFTKKKIFPQGWIFFKVLSNKSWISWVVQVKSSAILTWLSVQANQLSYLSGWPGTLSCYMAYEKCQTISFWAYTWKQQRQTLRHRPFLFPHSHQTGLHHQAIIDNFLEIDHWWENKFWYQWVIGVKYMVKSLRM